MKFIQGGSGSSTFSTHQKVILITVGVGITVVGIMARYLLRRRPHRPGRRSPAASVAQEKATQQILRNSIVLDDAGSVGAGTSIDSNFSKAFASAVNASPRLRRAEGHRQRSSSISSVLTQSTLISVEPHNSTLNCTQLGVLGLETLEKSISFWEESLHMVDENIENGDSREASTKQQLIRILDLAYELQKATEELYLNENSALYSEKSYGRLRSVSSVESFMSAEDWLSDDDEITKSLQVSGFFGEGGDAEFPLYAAALRLVEANTVPYRSLKTDMVSCRNGDQEYLAKLHCLRGAFSRIISDSDKKVWIMCRGKEVLSGIMMKADKDPSDFEDSLDRMVSWCQEGSNWALIESELKDRGLRALTFYDIVLDFIFLDAFEDLDAPPASVLAVTQNRWLSNSFKETALGTAVWSVLKTKRKWLRYPDGFMGHFYDLSEHIMPTLAWGFLGPSSSLQDLCNYFKDKFLEFLEALYSFDKVRYTSLDELATDVLKRMEELHSDLMRRMSDDVSSNGELANSDY
ncbi:Protein FAM73B [Orchesella cincta]|uniref:Protein FAM73B n=1 Tax=Orchesella cincta TaxID=48709 RepID=A0A1D2NAJ8_ORCCI|nr:Protein FAM73B [Orchesella cincta]